ncbi:MAG TPA: methyltransferase domain-containing protein [Pyrinomonadaceae bacterium]|nr:methyltransferase domain-containing protein [Pyrinomonadaceae bacterium]
MGEVEGQILNLGSGLKPMPGAVNLDVRGDTKPDVVFDLNQRPWPFDENQFARVYASDVIEHLDDTVATMEEIHRVCRSGAMVHINVPHFSSAGAFTDPTHRRYFGAFSFEYFVDGHFYTRSRFNISHKQLIFQPSLTNKIIWRLANRNLAAYEQRWAWIFPAFFLYIELEVLK